jgi:hypothetical protein
VFLVREDRVELDLFNSDWTEGQALKIRGAVLRLGRELRKVHPRSLPWTPREPEAEENQMFIEAAASYANAFWQGLTEIGALDVDQWGYWMPLDG